MNIQLLVRKWFEKWEVGEFLDLPISENFKHTSPYGVIEGKKEYLSLVVANMDKFAGQRFSLHDELYGENKACVRYTVVQDDLTFGVSEWYFAKNGLIEEIMVYYNMDHMNAEERALVEPVT